MDTHTGNDVSSSDLLDQLNQHRLIAVIDSTGSDTSSLLQQKALAQLNAGFPVNDRYRCA